MPGIQTTLINDIDYVLELLHIVSTRGSRAKPTVAELRDMSRRLENARAFLKATVE